MRDKGRSGVTSPAGPNNADATATVFVADHLAHQNYSGGPLAVKTVPVQCPQYEKLLEVCASAQRKVNIEYHRIVIYRCARARSGQQACRKTTRPVTRSAMSLYR